MYEAARPFLLAVAIGLLIGLERERAHADRKTHDPLGSRTFTLLAMLGAVAAYVESPGIGIVLSSFAGAIIVAGYFRSPLGADAVGVGATTEVAAMVTFILGYLVRFEPVLGIMLATVTLVVLALKPRIHHFARAGLNEKEISASLTFLVIAFVVTPLLPNRNVDPWNLINPSRLWLVFVMMAGVSFAGYIAVRVMGPGRGMAAAGFFSGFVSSTATTMSLAQTSREEETTAGTFAVGIVLANVASVLAQLLIVGATSPPLLPAALPVLLAPILVGAGAAWLAIRIVGQAARAGLTLENPLALKSTAKFAVVLGIVLIVSSAAGRFFGSRGVLATAVLVGSTDVHAVTLAIGTLARGGNISIQDAVLGILIAFCSNMVVKLVLAAWAGGRRLLMVVGPPLLGMMGAAIAAYFALRSFADRILPGLTSGANPGSP